MTQANQHTGIVTRKIMETLAKHPKGTTVLHVSLTMGHSHKSVKSTIRRLCHEGMIARVGYMRSGTRHGGNPAIYRAARPEEVASLRDAVVARSSKMSPRDCDIAFTETPKAAAKFAKLMGSARFEDGPIEPERGRLPAASGGMFSATGCAALMCLT